MFTSRVIPKIVRIIITCNMCPIVASKSRRIFTFFLIYPLNTLRYKRIVYTYMITRLITFIRWSYRTTYVIKFYPPWAITTTPSAQPRTSLPSTDSGVPEPGTLTPTLWLLILGSGLMTGGLVLKLTGSKQYT